MKKFTRLTITLAVMILSAQAILAVEPNNYYNAADGKSDEPLMSALCGIIRSHTTLGYNALWNAFKTTDTDALGYIIDMYSNCRYTPEQHGGNGQNVGDGFNREHSFPKSWFDDASPMYTDLFHLYPTDIKVNNQRSNYPFGVCENGKRLVNGNLYGKGKLGTSTYPGYNGTVFEPDDEYKGDFARTYFYMVTCYKNELPSWPGSPQLNYNANKYKAFSTWSINMLMEWTRLDPVSEKEIKRNDAVFGLQGNRNPFIDHPELAEYIWGNKQGERWNYSGQEIVASIITPVASSTVNMGTTTLGTVLSCTVNLKGEGLSEGLMLSMTDNEHFSVSDKSFSADEVNAGTSFVINFTADNEGTFKNIVTLSSSEVATTFNVIATAKDGDTPPPPPVVLGDSIMEDWEDCQSGGYWTKQVAGHAFLWYFRDAGIWSDNMRHGELTCRLGKSSSSALTMLESVEDVTGIGFYAACFGSDGDAELSIAYSTDMGGSWYGLGTVTVTRGALQHYVLDVDTSRPVCFGISQISGSRVNIDDITIYRKPQQQPSIPGDVNHDGEVNIADINAIISIILGGAAGEDVEPDANHDGEVNIADINMVIDIILQS